MTFREYITSRVFFAQVGIAICIIVAIVFLFMFWLTYTTNHGQEITVPNLARLSEEQVEEKLSELDLEYVLLDTVDYKKDFPKYTVVEQEPQAGQKVKENRKIYIKINSGTFASVRVPDLIEKTFRQARPTLEAMGLEVGNISYVPYLGKDMVLEMKFNGKKLKPGDKVLKASKIDLVLGDGKVGFEEVEDTLQSPVDE